MDGSRVLGGIMNINEFMKENHLAILVEADIKNKVFLIRKNDIELESYDLFEQLILFSNTEKLFESVSGQLLPRIWTQGDVKCIISQPSDETIVALFYNNCMDARDNYFYAKQLDVQLRTLFRFP